jgi:hypothetical protein
MEQRPFERRCNGCLFEIGISDIRVPMKHFNPTINPFNGVGDHNPDMVIQRPLGTNAKELTP